MTQSTSFVRPRAQTAAWRLDRDALTMAGALVLLAVILIGLPVPLSMLPPPIGPAAEQFGAGARTTVLLTLVSGFWGLLLGVAIALARLSHLPAVRSLAQAVVWVVRGTPLLVQLLFVYFALPALLPGVALSDFWSAVLALAVNVGAYNSEVIRAGIQAIARGQWEAARSLGLKGAPTFFLVILPQATRVSLPPLVNNVVSLLKDSSLAYVIGVVELSLVGNRVQAESFRPIPVFITVAAVYLALTTVVTMFAHALERRMSKATG